MSCRGMMFGPQYDLNLSKMILLTKPKRVNHTQRSHLVMHPQPPPNLRIGKEPPLEQIAKQRSPILGKSYIAGNYYELQVRRKRKVHPQLGDVAGSISRKVPLQQRTSRLTHRSHSESQDLEGVVGKLKELYREKKGFEQKRSSM